MARITTLLADWVALNTGIAPPSARTLADALRTACGDLSDEVLRGLPALPDEAAEAMASEPFADRFEGVYLAAPWLESLASTLDLPIADIDGGWDLGDGEDVYFCPLVSITVDQHEPDDARTFVRVDQVRRWPDPPPVRSLS